MTILETTPIMTNFFCEYVVVGGLCLVVIFLLLIFACGLLCYIFVNKNMYKAAKRVEQITEISFGFVALFCVFALGSFLVYAIYQPDYTGKNQYKVLIDDSVSFNEIAENYKIVGQDKDLYILEDKESANE